MRTRCLGAAAGVLADRLLGEPSVEPHPVAALGTILGRIEDQLWGPSRLRGVLHAAAGTVIGLGAGTLLRSGALSTYIATSGRLLGDTALEVHRALREDDLDRGRALLPALAGRDPSHLDATEIARATVESVAENTVDAIVAPALWAAVLGARGALGHRAVNTLDSMVGHRSERYERFGWASARLDDAAAWVPARVTAGLVALARPSRAADVLRTVRRDAPAHPSPNAGVSEAAFAAALEVRLGGVNRYGDRVEHRAELGDGMPPNADDIVRAVGLSRDVSLVLAGILVAIGLRG